MGAVSHLGFVQLFCGNMIQPVLPLGTLPLVFNGCDSQHLMVNTDYQLPMLANTALGVGTIPIIL